MSSRRLLLLIARRCRDRLVRPKQLERPGRPGVRPDRLGRWDSPRVARPRRGLHWLGRRPWGSTGGAA
eukprot:2109823-Pyramimonas_sp.AAC.1